MLNSDKKIQIGERLAAIRAINRLSQKELGQRLGISWRTYQNYEVGSREVSADFVMRFCDAFSVRPEWLVDGAGGRDQIDEVAAFKETLLTIDRLATSMGMRLEIEDLADLSARLFRKRLDGFELDERDYRDFLEIKGKG